MSCEPNLLSWLGGLRLMQENSEVSKADKHRRAALQDQREAPLPIERRKLFLGTSRSLLDMKSVDMSP